MPKTYTEAQYQTESARVMLRQWVSDAHGDKESVARYMAYTLRIGGIRACRELINNAVSSTHTTTEQKGA